MPACRRAEGHDAPRGFAPGRQKVKKRPETRTAAARRQAETLLQRPVFGVERPLLTPGEFAVRATGRYR